MASSRPRNTRELVLTGVFTLGVVWFSILVWNIYGKEERARTVVNDTKTELAGVQSRQAVLTNDIHSLDTERGQEGLVRQTLGVARPGEEVIIMVPPAAATGTPPLSWWRRALQFIGL